MSDENHVGVHHYHLQFSFINEIFKEKLIFANEGNYFQSFSLGKSHYLLKLVKYSSYITFN